MRSTQFSWATAVGLILVLASCSQPATSLVSPAGETGPADPSALGCTSFCLDGGGYCVFGTNFDNRIHEGLLYVNKRSVAKTGWDANPAGERAQWTSRYGSVTFNLVGYQLVWAGMNEAGLMLSTMALEQSAAPAVDDRFPLVSPLWLQYQLDNHSTVEEVIASDAVVRISASPPRTVDHYLVCDRGGTCATIEFLDGTMVYYVGETLPAAALTNSTYEESVAAWLEGKLFYNSLVRFATAADWATRYRPTADTPVVDHAFEALAQVSSAEWTMWSIVFDPQQLRVYFRTRDHPEIRHVDFSELDFSCLTPVKMYDIHELRYGDVSDNLKLYAHKASLDHFVNVMAKLGYDASRGAAREQLRQAENYPCTEDGSPAARLEPQDRYWWVWAAAAAVLAAAALGVWVGVRWRAKGRG